LWTQIITTQLLRPRPAFIKTAPRSPRACDSSSPNIIITIQPPHHNNIIIIITVIPTWLDAIIVTRCGAGGGNGESSPSFLANLLPPNANHVLLLYYYSGLDSLRARVYSWPQPSFLSLSSTTIKYIILYVVDKRIR